MDPSLKPQKVLTLPTPCFQTASLQNCEITNFLFCTTQFVVDRYDKLIQALFDLLMQKLFIYQVQRFGHSYSQFTAYYHLSL